jgi:hypothetical protein
MSQYVKTYWVFPDGVDVSPVVQSIESGWNDGWYSEDADADYVRVRSGDDIEYQSIHINSIGDEISSSENLSVRFNVGDLGFSLSVWPNGTELIELPFISLSTSSTTFDYRSDKRGTQEECRDLVRDLVGVVRTITVTTEPPHAFGNLGGFQPDDELPSKRELRNGRIDSLHWLTVFSEPAIDRLGRDRILQAPAWHVEELDTGQILLVVTDNPRVPTDEWEGAFERTREHLGLSW